MDRDEVLRHPSRHYDSPQAVVDDPNIPRERKIAILRQWAYDAQQLQVAEDENMGGGDASGLHGVLEALHRLGVNRAGDEDSGSRPSLG